MESNIYIKVFLRLLKEKTEYQHFLTDIIFFNNSSGTNLTTLNVLDAFSEMFYIKDLNRKVDNYEGLKWKIKYLSYVMNTEHSSFLLNLNNYIYGKKILH